MSKNMHQFLPFLLIFAGIIWGLIGAQTLRNHREFSQTTAVITDIQENYNIARGETVHRVFVRFTADGSSYDAELGTYVIGYKVGKQVRISYDPTDPTHIQSAGIGTSLVFLVICPVAVVSGIVILVKRRR